MPLPAILSKLKIGEGFKSFADGAKAIIKEFHLSPEDEMKFQQAIDAEANRHSEAMQSNVIKELELGNADRDSARGREEAFLQATGRADYFQYFIGAVAVVATCFMVFYVLRYEIPEKNEHVVMLAIGELLGIVSTIFAYHFGSSMGSRIKDMKK